MQQLVRFGVVAALAVVMAGCGTAARTMPTVKTGAVSVRAEGALGMKAAFAKAVAHTQAAYGDDFRPVMLFADHFLDVSGQLQPATWRFNMVGHLRGQSGYSLIKVQIRPDGTPFVDPKRGGPFPDRNNDHLLPVLDVPTLLDPEGAAWAIVKTAGYAGKYPPTKPVSLSIRPSDRLKQTVMTFAWYSIKQTGFEKTHWMVDTALDPVTGEVIENGAYKN